MASGNSDPNTIPQPFLPRVRLIWSFVLVTAAAVLIMLVRWAGEGQSLLTALLAILAWMALLLIAFSVLFMFTYTFGILEDLLAPPETEVLSPFARDRLPEQIAAPIHLDDK